MEVGWGVAQQVDRASKEISLFSIPGYILCLCKWNLNQAKVYFKSPAQLSLWSQH